MIRVITSRRATVTRREDKEASNLWKHGLPSACLFKKEDQSKLVEIGSPGGWMTESDTALDPWLRIARAGLDTEDLPYAVDSWKTR
ncbi:hypothetical protein ASPTUDRAFT_36667 [Aspergillus tubingensis CBS 134.48]|uniref:Uncharacterized protein n=1 Tax=Aspergillus tubingensis (strain CBS 134.48) TaxID=767770 RepID=A0A1L9NL50_ASPTC|nr:hypothetical protein ASPTUDRAFT_36667 [Aspergillus tubingensis CBS 134.48]